MNFARLTLISVSVAASFGAAAEPGDLEYTGSVGFDSRTFWEDKRDAAQHDGNVSSLTLEPELYWRSGDGRHRASIVAFGRLDADDDERSHADLREAYWGFEGDGWDVRAGFARVFWGVAESRHLVDVINQTDLVEDVDQEAKLGQPMINVNLQRDFGRFEIYYMPRFRERTFPGADGRLRTPLPVNVDDARYESADRDRHDDIALRYSHYVGDVDFGIYVFDGTSREPRFELDTADGWLVPVYDQMTQAGLDVQFTRDSWLWKLEAMRRDSRGQTIDAAVGGLEYTFYGVAGRAADLGVLVEYLYDDRAIDAPPTPFDDDVFFGARLALNDVDDTSVLAGAVVDRNSNETFLSVEAERRFGDNLIAELRMRAFSNAEPGTLLAAFENDDYVEMRLSWYY